MTKEDFKKKYHGKSVKIETLMQEASVHQRQSRIQSVCSVMGLEAHPVNVPAPYLLITIVDKNQTPYPYSHVEASEPVSEHEFWEDCKAMDEEEKFGKAKKLLADFKIEYGEISKSPTDVKNVMSTGFIQAYTSNEASLWWHPSGKRIFFVCGEGAFSITDKVEENA